MLFSVSQATPVKKGLLQDRIVLYPEMLALGSGDQKPSGRIVGGENAEPNEYPFIVNLRIDGKYFCGGSLISKHLCAV